MSRCFLCFVVTASLVASFISSPTAFALPPTVPARGNPVSPASIPGLALAASPSVADVGGQILLVLSARSWPGPVSVTVSFLSPHHGFTGKMFWTGSCACFRVAVSLAKRIHSLENARAVATVVVRTLKLTAGASFMIRGLARNGREYAPGGAQTLTTWVSNPQPVPREKLHFCAWVKTIDGLGVMGIPVSFIVHFAAGNRTLKAGVTARTGIACTRRGIGAVKTGRAVIVEAYAGSQRARTQFVPHP